MTRRKSYPGHIEKRGKSYRVHLCVAGKRHKYTITCSRRDAGRFAREKFAELERRAERRASGLPGSIPFSALLKQFDEEKIPILALGTQRSYRDSLKPIRKFFVEKLGDLPVDKIHAAHVSDFLDWRRVHGPHGEKLWKPRSNRTLAKDRAVLHRLFALADRLEFRDGNPVARTEPPKSDPRDPVILSDEQYEVLLAECSHDPMLQLYALTLGETGARCESEGLHLRWEDVDLEKGFIWIDSSREDHRTKSGKGRWVPVTPRLLDAMREHFATFRLATYGGERTPWVFHHTRRRRNARPGERIGSLRRAFRSACSRARLPDGFVQHDLRHRRVTTWLAQEKSPALVKEAMGHSDLRTTMGYMHLSREHLRVLVRETPARERLGSLRT